MRTRTSRWTMLTAVLLVASALLACVAQAQPTGASRLTSDDPNNWPMYHRSYDSFRFSPLAQINKDNVKNLSVAWVHQPGAIVQGLEATPLVVEVGGRPQVIVNGMNKIRSYDLETGNLAWEAPGTTMNPIPSPVFEKGVVFLMSGFRGNNLKAIQLADAKGDLTGSKAILWEINRDTPYVPSPLLYDGILYFLKTNSGILSAFDAQSGKPHYQAQRLAELGEVFSSPVGAQGRVYITGRDGVTLVLRNSPKYEVLAKNTLEDGFDASPALVETTMYMRGYKFLYAISGQ